MNISDSSGIFEVQSASFHGSPAHSKAHFLKTVSLAARAASLALAANIDFHIIALAS